MSDNTSNNKRIAKNTLFLYGRMLLIMVVSLFTSRVVLNTLGVENFGIYNVVGGVVTMFAFLNSSLVASTQRYLTFELGRGNQEQLKKVFTTSIHIHAIISLIIIILGETVGLWFFYNKMVIPETRMFAATWVYHLSILTMVIRIMSAPYNSVIVAHEKMNVFATISIVEVVLKLIVVYLLLIGNFDKLILYAVLNATVQLFIRFLYSRYCNRNYEESIIIKFFDKSLLKEMGKFAGWNVWGNLASTLFSTGLNILLNVFFGPVVNAARAVAVQVESVIVQFSNDFLVAVNPQITKFYAKNKLKEMHSLLFRAAKFTCFLLLLLSLPVVMEAKMVLTVWLKIVPEYTVSFLRVLLCIVIIDSMARPLMTAAAATGDVKKYQSIVGGILLSIVPIAYIVLKMGGNPVSVYIVHLTICVVAFVTRLFIIRPMIKLSISSFFISVVLPCFMVGATSFFTALMVKIILPETLICSAIVCVLSVVIVAVLAYMIGLTKGERAFINEKIVTAYSKILHRDKNIQ